MSDHIKKIVEGVSNLTEAPKNHIKLNITQKSRSMNPKTYSQVVFMSVNGFEMIPKDDDFPMPWDANFKIESNQFVISGSAGPSGFGSAQTKIPLTSVPKVLNIGITIDDDDNIEEVRSILSKHEWL